jgi:hypothetical protein
MQRFAFLLVLSSLLTACPAEDWGDINSNADEVRTYTIDTISPLSDFNAKLVLTQETGDIAVTVVTDACMRLSSSAVATLDGVEGAGEFGSMVSEVCSYGNCTPMTCSAPTFRWTQVRTIDKLSVFVLTDKPSGGTTTWTFEVYQPAVRRTFKRTAPATTGLKSGDSVTLQLDPPVGDLSLQQVAAGNLFALEPGIGVTQTGPNLQFSVPTVTAPIDRNIDVGGTVALATPACNAPNGCSADVDAEASLPTHFDP